MTELILWPYLNISCAFSDPVNLRGQPLGMVWIAIGQSAAHFLPMRAPYKSIAHETRNYDPYACAIGPSLLPL